MACPFFSSGMTVRDTKKPADMDMLRKQDGFCSVQSEDDLTYHKYLQLDKILNAQLLRSSLNGHIPMHDEHLFIITHQAFELWFRQILHEIDSIRAILTAEYLEERNSLCVIARLNRVIAILKLCCDQFAILETMTPQDFLDFRDALEGASGFQSLQFRLMEVRLGVVEELRVSYNKQNYLEVFFDADKKQIQEALSEPSLLQLVNKWLGRTPGIKSQAFDFWSKFKVSVSAMLEDMKAAAQEEINGEIREHKLRAYKKTAKSFNELFDENFHNDLLKKYERRFSYSALQGAMMIFFYRDEPRFHLPYQLLRSLMDLDSQFMKLRFNHASMVQRMVGSKVGSGGSSGYFYLRSTCSDRYKIFLDLFHAATYLVPRQWIPPLSCRMKKSLSLHKVDIPERDIFGYEDHDSGNCEGSVSSFPTGEEDTNDNRSHPSAVIARKESFV